MAISKIGPLALTNGGGSVATNTASGTNALNSNTSGAYNSAFGYSALQANTTASGNTAVGYKAGYAATTGGYDAYFGYQSGQAKNTASDNFGSAFFGGSSGEATSTGIDNAFFGAQAARANLSGSYNTAIGSAALKSNTTASNNTAVGYQAGYSNTTADGGTYVGYQAGYSSTNTNTAFGRSALYSTTGILNTALGWYAGNAITTGTKNTIVGSYTGNNGGLDIRTASNRIVLSDGDGNPRLYYDNNGAIQSTSAVGDAVLYPAYFSRAWVNFNGTGTVAITGSGNVSSITDTGTGSYTVNFTNSLPDTNYSVNISTTQGDLPSYNYMVTGFAQGGTVSGTYILCRPVATSDTKIDLNRICVAVFR